MFALGGHVLSVLFQCEDLILGFSSREADLRAFAEDLYVLRFRQVKDPIIHAWLCGKQAFLGGAFDGRFGFE